MVTYVELSVFLACVTGVSLAAARDANASPIPRWETNQAAMTAPGSARSRITS